MATNEPGKSVCYTVVIDEARSDILNVLGNAAAESPLLEKYLREDPAFGKLFLDFMEELGQKRHDMNWCKDKHCTWHENHEQH